MIEPMLRPIVVQRPGREVGVSFCRYTVLATIPPTPPNPMTKAEVKDRLEAPRMLFCEYAMTAGTLLCAPAMVRNAPKYLGPSLPAYARITRPTIQMTLLAMMNGARSRTLSLKTAE